MIKAQITALKYAIPDASTFDQDRRQVVAELMHGAYPSGAEQCGCLEAWVSGDRLKW